MLAFIAKIFSHGAARIRCDKLQGRRIAGTGRHDGGVFHGAVFLKHGMYLGHRGFFLSAGHVNAVDIRFLLGQNSINGAGRFTDLAVTDNQFPLSLANRGHGVNGL